MSKLLTKAEAAPLLGLTVRALEGAMKRRAIDVIRLSGKSVRISTEAVEKFIHARTIEAV